MALPPPDGFYKLFVPETFVHPALLDDRYVPPYRGNVFMATAIVTLAVTVLILGAKIYTRARIIKRLGRDDWVAGAALVCFFSPSLPVRL
jgi:hypothetical protein